MLINFEEELHRLIAERAQELSSQKNGESKEEVNDWLMAEQEILYELDCRSNELLKDNEIRHI
jgi:hypothetical protein